MPNDTPPSVLPTEDEIASTVQEDWWLEDQEHGFISPLLLAPDPDQPRSFMDPDELQALTDSIEKKGVVESIVVTPLSKTPWVTVSDKDRGAFFVIVSGHRSPLRTMPAAPIRSGCS